MFYKIGIYRTEYFLQVTTFNIAETTKQIHRCMIFGTNIPEKCLITIDRVANDIISSLYIKKFHNEFHRDLTSRWRQLLI